MACCRQCEGIESQFSRKVAERELRRFRKRGPVPTTRRLLDALASAGVVDFTLLDVGGGIGAIHHVLLDQGVHEAVHVDASSGYLAVAKEESARRGHAESVRFVGGDFVELADELPEADVVTLDRVICCYPDMQALVARSAARARRLYGAVYPREAWWMRAAGSFMNLFMRVQRSAFRLYLHSPAAIDAVLRAQGLERRSSARTLIWEIVVYQRTR